MKQFYSVFFLLLKFLFFFSLCLSSNGNRVFADTTGTQRNSSFDSEPVKIKIPPSLKYQSNIEASAALFLDDIDKYLIVSDDTHKKQPVLFLMNSMGQVYGDFLIDGLDKINDMESITADSLGRIYIASSQSINKNGKLPESRKLLIRIRRENESFKLDNSIILIDLIETVALKNSQSEWAKFIIQGLSDNTIDIEGIFYKSGAIYLGFKQPLLDNHAVILQINHIDYAFENKIIRSEDITVWQKLLLKDSLSGAYCGISDMMLQDEHLYLLTCAERKGNPLNSGGLWLFNTKSGILSHQRMFKGLRPEGIAYDKKRGEYLVAFDNGSDYPSEILFIKGTLQ